MPYIPPTKNTERREHLKNLIRHSCYSKLILSNSVLNPQAKGNDGFKQIQKEITEALEYLKQDGRVKITTAPYDEDHTILRLKLQEESD